jgi:hypothetical protein
VADFSAIREALAVRVRTVTTLQYRTHTNVPPKVVTPAAFIAPDNWDYHQTMGSSGLNHAKFSVTVLAAPFDLSTNERAQLALDAFLDDSGATTSVKAAIEGDLTLNGTVNTLIVTGVRDYGVIEWNGLNYIGAVLDVEVWG